MHARLAILIGLLSAPAFGAASAQQPPRPVQPPRDQPSPAVAAVGTGSISGTVVIAGSGDPSRRARVTLGGAELRGSRTANTDEQGRFAFGSLPAGRYTLTASKAGHIAVTYGQRSPGTGRPGTPIQLADGEKFETRLQMPRGGVITGTVLDEHGEATPGTMVRVLRYVMQGGQRTLQQGGGGSTDDRGIYRIFGLQPGTYAVCATPRNVMGRADQLRMEMESVRRAAENVGRADPAQARVLAERAAALQSQMPEEEQEAGYAPVCYPGTTTSANAGPVPLGVSEERAGVNFQLQLVPVGDVEGTVTGPAGASLQNIQVTLLNTGMDVIGMGNTTSRPSSDGAFRISNVAPGQYKLVARATSGAQLREPVLRGQPTQGWVEPMRLWAAADVSVDGTNVSNVMLVLQPGMTVSGTIEFEGGRARPADLSRLRVNLAPTATGPAAREAASAASGRVDATGRFTIPNVMPGSYRLTATGANGWFLESSMIGGQDALDFPFEVKPNQNVSGAVITFGDQQSELSGTLLDGRSQPATDYTIIIFPADQKYWTPNSRRIRTARPATDGAFTVRTLPPGEYRLATVVDPEPGIWMDPDYLTQLDASSMSVRLGPGEKKVQNIRLSQ